MGIKNSNGRTPFSGSNQAEINSIFHQAAVEYAEIAAKDGLEIFKSYVPIDTHTLQESITARVIGAKAIIEVPDTVLNYGPKKKIDAKKLGIILEIGGNLHRSQSNTAPGTSKGSSTADWFEKAEKAVRNHLKPIGKQLLEQALQKALKVVLNG